MSEMTWEKRCMEQRRIIRKYFRILKRFGASGEPDQKDYDEFRKYERLLKLTGGVRRGKQ
jgi:hypothetical protein